VGVLSPLLSQIAGMEKTKRLVPGSSRQRISGI
jgi:hypothetical protein